MVTAHRCKAHEHNVYVIQGASRLLLEADAEEPGDKADRSSCRAEN